LKTDVKFNSGDTSVYTLDDLLSDLCGLDKVGVKTVREFIDLPVSTSRDGRVRKTYTSSNLVESDRLFTAIALEDPHDHVGDSVRGRRVKRKEVQRV
jgi:hypothetical protein